VADSSVGTVTRPQGEWHGFDTREGLAIIFSARPETARLPARTKCTATDD